MSIVIQIKGIILNNLKVPKELKNIVLKFLNELDNDLETGGYEPSSEMDLIVDELDKVLIDLDTIESLDDEENKDEEDDSKFQGREISTENDEE